ncbi:MAG: hypothetical protein WBO28_09845 [Flavobacteriales bacterium]
MFKQASLILLASTLLFIGCDKDPVDPPVSSALNNSGTGTGSGSGSGSGTGGGTSTSNLTITTFTPASLIKLCPQWIGGNQDFSGHGPEVQTTITLVGAGSSVLKAHIRYHLKETQSDWTEALYDEYITLYTAPSGKVINQVMTATYLNYEYLDTSHNSLTLGFSAQSLLSQLISMGDTDGNDVGNCTSGDAYLSVYWNPITVQLRPI